MAKIAKEEVARRSGMMYALKIAKEKGIKKILCNTCDQIFMVKSLGFEPYGNFSLNIFNSYDLKIFKELGLNEEDYGFYLDLRKYGSTRHAGFGLGFERCVMYLTGMANIRDVIPFPRTPRNAEF